MWNWITKNLTLLLAMFILFHVVVFTWFIAENYYKLMNTTKSGTTKSGNTANQGNSDDLQDIKIPNAVLEKTATAKPTTQAALVLGILEQSYARAISTAKPAVVFIETTSVRTVSLKTAGSVTLDPALASASPNQKIGSGVIIDEDGLVLTNHHVIEDAQVIYVTPCTAQKQRYTASLIRADADLDIALIKINADVKFTAALMGNSDGIEIGETIFAVGSPFGFEHTATRGIVSDTSRSLMIGDKRYDDMIQTDAAVNRGNSGGALVNGRGYVIGITTAIYAPTGVFNGLSFAIPVNKIRDSFSDIVYAN
ncbi:MAG: trypsin-like peptidase domain-containing protein [Deltaproteobacteria bacterium]|nr:trypsin-like peptidase domain-containing protein [Deltaproteobacteria bacterium]